MYWLKLTVMNVACLTAYEVSTSGITVRMPHPASSSQPHHGSPAGTPNRGCTASATNANGVSTPVSNVSDSNGSSGTKRLIRQ